MKNVKIGSLEVSDLGLGGSKFLNMPIADGLDLLATAKKCGIRVIDAHHRYGNAEAIFGLGNDFIKMTKVSSYNTTSAALKLVSESRVKLGKIDIMWISDLDDITLYEQGANLYTMLEQEFSLLGITTENPSLAYKFMDKNPQCNLFMVPVFIGMEEKMISFIKEAQSRGKKVFAIKSFLDKLLLKKYTINDCLSFAKCIGPDVLLCGTSNKHHLVELVNKWEELR